MSMIVRSLASDSTISSSTTFKSGLFRVACADIRSLSHCGHFHHNVQLQLLKEVRLLYFYTRSEFHSRLRGLD